MAGSERAGVAQSMRPCVDDRHRAHHRSSRYKQLLLKRLVSGETLASSFALIRGALSTEVMCEWLRSMAGLVEPEPDFSKTGAK
jgi:hypothetical protein